MLTKPRPEPDLFSYPSLRADVATAAQRDAEFIKGRVFVALQAWCDVGEALKRQREALGIHDYLGWIKLEFGWDQPTVSEFISIHDYWGEKYGISQAFKAGITKSIALEVARKNTPPEVRDRVESLLVDGQKVTVADIRKLTADGAILCLPFASPTLE